MRVRLIHGCRERFAGGAASVTLPGEAGELVVLTDHAPLLCVLGSGTVQIDEFAMPIQGGLAAVDRNTVTILMR